MLERCDANVSGALRPDGSARAWRRRATTSPARKRLAFATMLLDAGARMDVRDDLLQEHAARMGVPVGAVELVQTAAGTRRGPGGSGRRALGDAAGHGRRRWGTTRC